MQVRMALGIPNQKRPWACQQQLINILYRTSQFVWVCVFALCRRAWRWASPTRSAPGLANCILQTTQSAFIHSLGFHLFSPVLQARMALGIPNQKRPWARQVGVLFWRGLLDMLRNPLLTAFHALGGLLLGLLVGIIFFSGELCCLYAYLVAWYLWPSCWRRSARLPSGALLLWYAFWHLQYVAFASAICYMQALQPPSHALPSPHLTPSTSAVKNDTCCALRMRMHLYCVFNGFLLLEHTTKRLTPTACSLPHLFPRLQSRTTPAALKTAWEPSSLHSACSPSQA
jgi:hypothetical protein